MSDPIALILSGCALVASIASLALGIAVDVKVRRQSREVEARLHGTEPEGGSRK